MDLVSTSRRMCAQLSGVLGCLVIGWVEPSFSITLQSGSERPVVVLPAVFDEGRVRVCPTTAGGDVVCFYTDTGGGVNILFDAAAARLNLVVDTVTIDGNPTTFADWPVWDRDSAIPPPADTRGWTAGRLLVRAMSENTAYVFVNSDGLLGRSWFADRTWTFDYEAGQLLIQSSDHPLSGESAPSLVLGFQEDATGQRTTHFPRLRVEIDGDSLDLLFDTGATARLTEQALAVLNDGRPAIRASSFISAAVFDQWRAAHRDWPVIENGTALEADLIEVPLVTIAGHSVGPIWFERRDVGVFEDYMSQWMDRQVVGALGGNALQFFRVTIDYQRAVAVFERNP